MPDRVTANDSQIRCPSLDEIIEAFEIVWNRDHEAQVENFLPDRDHPQYEAVALELLCVDLERRRQNDERKTIDAYCQQFPDLLAHQRARERLAFEEYRWLKEHGHPVTPAEYARKYDLRTDHWPNPTAGPQPTRAGSSPGDVEPLKADRLPSTLTFPNVGDRFLGFKIVQPLGESKFGRVYLATQTDLANRRVVIKVAEEVWSESERLARLQHANVVPIHSVHQQDGLQAVCMPYLGRQTLADVLKNINDPSQCTGSDLLELIIPVENTSAATLPDRSASPLLRQLRSLNYEQLCARIVAQIASGLGHAHQRGILHRDLKPANVLLTDEGQPMILDFNLSDDIVAGGRASLLVGGTLPYMAPEHLSAVFSDGHIDVRSDIYSLGVILFQLLTGRLPFPPHDGSIVATLGLVIHERANTTPSAGEFNCKISPALDSVLRRCLAPNPDQRYQSASQLEEDLQLHLQDYPLRHAPNRSVMERTRKWLRRHPQFASAGALASVFGGVLAVLLCLFVLRGHHVAKLEAINEYQRFEELARVAKAPLSAHVSDEESFQYGWQAARQACAIYDVESPGWKRDTSYRWLDRDRQMRLDQSVQELLFYAAGATYRRAQRIDGVGERQRELQLALRSNRASRAQRSTRQTPAALLIQEADIQRLLGQDDLAARLLRQAHELPAGAELDVYLQAVQDVASDRYADAVPRLTELVRKTPRNFFAWFLLGNCYYGSGVFVEADTCFTRCAALWPENHLAYFQRGVCRLRQGQFAQAERDFTDSLERLPEQTTSYLNRALALMGLGRYPEAVEDLTAAIERGRDRSQVYILRSKAWEKLGNFELADRDLQAGLRLTPVSVDGWIQRGMVRRATSPERALSDLEAALRLDPKSRKALQNKAHLLSEKLNRPFEAIETLDRMLELNPHDALALAGRAVLRSRLGERKAAHQDARDALKWDRSPQTCYQAACAYAQTSQLVAVDAVEAVNLLGEATKQEIRWAAAATKDPDMRPLAESADFRKLVGAAYLLHRTKSTLLDNDSWAER